MPLGDLMLGVWILALTGSADAFTTRIHISLANDIREALLQTGNRIPLQMGEQAVVLSDENASAIVDHPLEFRAGAIGPDNFVFPGMTDPSHAIGLRPYDQCQILLDMALTPPERAYALGCFLHGSTDAVAHHYVNAMSGETFSLNPISTGRVEDWSNVIRHMVAEEMIQEAAVTLRPDSFDAAHLMHTIPEDFVVRSYYDEDSPLWLAMSIHARAKHDATVAANPDAALPDIVAASGLAPAEHLLMLPVYTRMLGYLVDDLRGDIEATRDRYLDPLTLEGAELDVGPGPDGLLGTLDDSSGCSWDCPTAYATYFTCLGLLVPRQDAAGNPLESAFDKIAADVLTDLYAILPAVVHTVNLLSARLNEPVIAGAAGFDYDLADLDAVTAPMDEAVSELVLVDYETLVQTAAPPFLLAVEAFLESFGIGGAVSSVVASLMQPYLDAIEEVIETKVLGAVEAYAEEYIAEYEANSGSTEKEYAVRLAAASPKSLGGTALDHWYDSGMYANAFNLAAVAFADPQMVLPQGDAWDGLGPASFDASHTLAWSQPAVCDYLATTVFPLGTDVSASLSVRLDGVDHRASMDDSPFECHDGLLTAFADQPSADNCAATDLDTLLVTSVGSLSRSFPPEVVGANVACLGRTVPGLPGPTEPEPEEPEPEEPEPSVPPPVADEASQASSGCGVVPTAPSAAWLGVLLAFSLVGCRREGEKSSDGMPTDGTTEETPTPTPTDETDTPPEPTEIDTGSNPDPLVDALVLALGDSTWSGTGLRNGIVRIIEQQFRADQRLWAEVVNPWGPARSREMRVFSIDLDGEAISSTVVTPAGWEIGPENGRVDAWTFVLDAGSPRTLTLTRGGEVEVYTEGAVAAPTTGLTAEAIVFAPGGNVDDAFCDSGSAAIEYDTLFAAARGDPGEPFLAEDAVAGVALTTWSDASGNNDFALRDVPGFERDGGTLLSDQYNFIVRYRGAVVHAGGDFAMRERNDSVEDGVWAFAGDNIGSDNVNDLFLEVHGFVSADLTSDEPSKDTAAADVPVEFILIRCTDQIEPVDVELRLGVGAWTAVGASPTLPELDPETFPAPF